MPVSERLRDKLFVPTLFEDFFDVPLLVSLELVTLQSFQVAFLEAQVGLVFVISFHLYIIF